MSDLRELYQEVILDHNRSPRNFRRLDAPVRTSRGVNPLCGDRIELFVKLGGDGETIEDVAFQGSGCAISRASSSLMTEAVKGKTRAEAEELFHRFQDLVTSSMDGLPDIDGLGKLAVFAGVREFPARVKCAILPWHALHAALEGKDEPVSTE